MSWQGIEGHDEVVGWLRSSLARGRLASTFLFVGPPGVGKRTFALRFAQTLLCAQVPEREMAPCGECPSCQQVLAGTHPDLEQVARPPDRATIPLDLFIGEPGKRLREGLCHNLALKPFLGGRKVAIIDDADHLNEEGANCLLKTLEEPPPRSVLMLIGGSEEKQLPTIRSRCQIVRFGPLPAEVVARLLVARDLVADPEQARRLAKHSEGSLARALNLADDAIWSVRDEVLKALAQAQWNGVALSARLIQFAEEVGTELARRRARLRPILEAAAAFYLALGRRLLGATIDDAELAKAVEPAVAWFRDPERAFAAVDRTLEALSHLEGYIGLNALVDGWLDDVRAETQARVVPPTALRHAP